MSSFQAIALGEPGDLIEASLEFARDQHPDVDVRAYCEFVDEIGDRFEAIADDAPTPEIVLRRLNQFFFQRLRFSGNTRDYYDPRNSYLNYVLDRRLGIPISLSVVYRELAARAGVRLEGVNVPGNFSLAHRLEDGSRMYIDVFRGGRFLNWRQFVRGLVSMFGPMRLEESEFPPMSEAEILVRMLRNLKSIHFARDLEACVRVQQRIVQLLPDSGREAWELGMLFYRAGKPMLALRTLESAANRCQDPPEDLGYREQLEIVTRAAVLVN